jgi:hypothetical protein
MPPVTHQTVRLSRGAHRSPDQGMCAMELASTLAGEPFSDHPQCVSPVVAAFARVYNDSIDDERRQDLLRYAADAVGTAASEDLEHRRALRCMAWIRENAPRRRVLVAGGFRLARKSPPTAGVVAARVAWRGAAHGDAQHRAALALLGELIAMRDGVTVRSGREFERMLVTSPPAGTESHPVPESSGTA